MRVKFLILGAGPTGLGAAWRLNELGESDWLLLEKNREPGGLAGSVLDEKGYTWDQGGHIQFSHYDYFDGLMDELLTPDEWLHHQRESWIWTQGRFAPYPFQNNLRYLPNEAAWDCLRSLLRVRKNPSEKPPENFSQWTKQSFGEGICKLFMRPYNEKVWAYPLEELSHQWIGDRVATVDVDRVLDNVIRERDDRGWGPNQTFRFPLRGGTGEVWRRCARRLPTERLKWGAEVEGVDTKEKGVRVAGSNEAIGFEHLISTLPLQHLIEVSDLAHDPETSERAALLRHSSTHIIGLGVKGKPPSAVATKCWMYFPEDDCPFYRATVFSNYSPNNVPDINKGWSLMCEVSESPFKPVDHSLVVEETIRGVLATGLVNAQEDVVHVWHRRLPFGYPTPSLERDRALTFLLPKLEKSGIFSRGRFGAWKYEVSNQDHSLMQGVECVNHLLRGEEELTLHHPEVVNRPRTKAEK